MAQIIHYHYLVKKKISNLPLFWIYVGIYHLFETRVYENRVYREIWVLQKIFKIELEYHEKLDFPKLEYPKSGRSLHISKTVVDC